ncbi:hypothetical protein BT93_F1279 [Corymbia citriodora subsp. variegata]|nr:hypothetical protein BT93_F1279 [Corymbia citriodora subsp. variegata]
MKTSASGTPPPSHRYLKPGALARLRDSRISSRYHRPDPLSRSHAPRSDPSRARDQAAPLQISGTDPTPPQLLSSSTGCGPRCLTRKRLVAHRSGFLQSLNSNVSRGGGDSFINVTGNDALVAH